MFVHSKVCRFNNSSNFPIRVEVGKKAKFEQTVARELEVSTGRI